MAVQFSADNQAYTATTGLPGSTYTVLAWVYLSVDRNASSTMWTHGSGSNGHNIWTSADGTTLAFDSAGGSFTAGSLTVGAWTKVAFTANGTTGTIYSAADGAALASTGTGTIPTVTFTNIFIGAFSNATSGFWLNGRIADFKVYTAVLTLSEMEAELAQYTPVRTANLLRYHPFHVAETTDYSGNGNDLSAGTGATTAADPTTPQDPVSSVLRIPIQTIRVP